MVLLHEFLLDLPLEQPGQGLNQSYIADQLRAFAWKSEANHPHFRQVSRTINQEEVKGLQIESAVKENLDRQRIAALHKQVLKEVRQFSFQSANMVSDGSAH